MTGWELEKPGELLQYSRNRLDKTLNGFLKQYRLAAVSPDHNICVSELHGFFGCHRLR